MRNSCLGVSIISYKCIRCGCLIILRIWISLATLSMSATSEIFSFSRIFIATFSPVIMCVPSLTFPKVPLPILFPISFRLNFIDYLIKLLSKITLNYLFVYNYQYYSNLCALYSKKHK